MDESCRKFSKWVENTTGKGEIVRCEQFRLFPVFFNDLYSKHVKTRVVWERVNVTGSVRDLPKSGRPRVTTLREDGLIT